MRDTDILINASHAIPVLTDDSSQAKKEFRGYHCATTIIVGHGLLQQRLCTPEDEEALSDHTQPSLDMTY